MNKPFAVAALVLLAALASFAQESPSTLATTGGGTLYGTLLLPKGSAKVPVVLIIAGSGPTDRNGNSALVPGKNNSFRMLAEGLAANGIASLRYDKRGVGESAKAAVSESDLRIETYMDDAAAWCKQLREDPRFSGVVIAGHSEGSLIGMVAAKRCNATAFISIAGAGRPAGSVLRRQLVGKLTPDLARTSETILEGLEQGKTTSVVPESLMVLYRPSVQPYMISWLKYDPVKEIAELKIPTLVVQGTTDIQLISEDARRLVALRRDASVAIIEGMNHVLKSVPADDIAKQGASYGDPSLPLAPGLVEKIVKFVRGVVKK